MKQTAWAPANIAYIKYWGKSDLPAQAGENLRIPLNDSLSMNMSGAFTVTTVEFSGAFTNDTVTLLDGQFLEAEVARVIAGLDRIREKAGRNERARVVTRNSFPKGAGSAASASGFAALTVAGFAALGIHLTEKELSVFARLGSGSACRSIPSGFVVWQRGESSETSYAYSLYPPEYWDIRDVLVIVDRSMKKVSTTDGMRTVATSPFLSTRLAAVSGRMRDIQRALRDKDFLRFGQITEEDCLDMHRVMQTQVPPLLYWNDATRNIMDEVKSWRNGGLPVYFTIDAGPNVHILCEGKDEARVMDKIRAIPGIIDVVRNKPSVGAHLIQDHLC